MVRFYPGGRADGCLKSLPTEPRCGTKGATRDACAFGACQRCAEAEWPVGLRGDQYFMPPLRLARSTTTRAKTMAITMMMPMMVPMIPVTRPAVLMPWPL